MGVYWDATIDREADSEENRWLEELSLRETQQEGRARQREYEEQTRRDQAYAEMQDRLGWL